MKAEEIFEAEQGIANQREAKRKKEAREETILELPLDPGRITQTLTLACDKYIAKPYWPEIYWLFTLDKAALVHPKHSAQKKDQILQSYCNNNSIPWADVLAARNKIAKEHWYRDANGNIVIPRMHLVCSWIQALRNHPLKKNIKVEQFRTFCNCTDGVITPVKTKADNTFRRYCSSEESNLRRLQEDEYITDFEVKTEVTYMSNIIRQKELIGLIKFAGVYFGMGSARKMDYGRYEVLSLA